MLKNRKHVVLSIAVTGDEPPTEFRIFSAGAVETKKGTFTFDDKAAESVMAAYAEHGIDLMIDYDHASLASVTLDPAEAGKAAGWFNLEVRGGELWAVNVRWTPPADAALRAKEWRFMSPAFQHDESGRVTGLLNVAITNLPATRRLEPLMAASMTALGENGMTVEEFIKVCKTLGIDMGGSVEDAMAKIKGEKPAEEKKDEPAADPAAEVAAAAAPAPADPEKDKPAEVAAALSTVVRLSGKASFVEALSDIEVWHASHLRLETETQKLAAERATLESAERRDACAKLVASGRKAPAEVWADDKATAPKKYLAAMPIADFREFVADANKASAKKPDVRPPAKGDAVAELSARELAMCAEMKIDPKTYAASKPAKKD